MGVYHKNNANSKARFYNISRGQIRIKAHSEDEGAVNIPNQKGEARFYQVSDGITGKIVKILAKPSENPEYKGSWVLQMVDEDGIFSLEIPMSSGYWGSFTKKLKNIDWDKDSSLEFYYFEETRSTSMNIFQDGKKVLPFFSKDDMGDVPTPTSEKDEVTDKVKWDFSKQEKYLLNILKTEVLPKLDQTELAHDAESNEFKVWAPKYSKQGSSTPKKAETIKEQADKVRKTEAIEEDELDLPF